jgi:hypothetical protein
MSKWWNRSPFFSLELLFFVGKELSVKVRFRTSSVRQRQWNIYIFQVFQHIPTSDVSLPWIPRANNQQTWRSDALFCFLSTLPRRLKNIFCVAENAILVYVVQILYIYIIHVYTCIYVTSIRKVSIYYIYIYDIYTYDMTWYVSIYIYINNIYLMYMSCICYHLSIIVPRGRATIQGALGPIPVRDRFFHSAPRQRTPRDLWIIYGVYDIYIYDIWLIWLIWYMIYSYSHK